jgi:hypothetical protein
MQELHRVDGATDDVPIETAANDLDFGELGHA